MAQRVKIFESYSVNDIDNQVNDFIKDKNVSNISTNVYLDNHDRLVYQCIILYSCKTLFNF